MHSPGSMPHNSVSPVVPLPSLPAAWKGQDHFPEAECSPSWDPLLNIPGTMETESLRSPPSTAGSTQLDAVKPSLWPLLKGGMWAFGICADRTLISLSTLLISFLNNSLPAFVQEANLAFNLTIPCRSMFEHQQIVWGYDILNWFNCYQIQLHIQLLLKFLHSKFEGAQQDKQF